MKLPDAGDLNVSRSDIVLLILIIVLIITMVLYKVGRVTRASSIPSGTWRWGEESAQVAFPMSTQKIRKGEKNPFDFSFMNHNCPVNAAATLTWHILDRDLVI